jgi:NAD(P)-dependent dehydrogenase (short-subunit alcohol dehydrogenase family)
MAVVLVTGGSSGIGLAVVRRLAAAGDQVFAASRNPQRAPLPEGVTPIAFDLADPRAADTTVASVVKAAGRLDVLINNAGTGTLGPLEETDDDEAHRILEVNLFGPMRLVRAAVPVMRSQGGGRIVNVTSMNDVLPAPFASWYSASKAALASASVALDAEIHGFGIFVTVVAPGLFRTEMIEGLVSFGIAEGSAYRKTLEGLRAENTVYIAGAGNPQEVADAIDQCVRADDPPARVVVGADAQELVKLVHDTDPDSFAKLLRAEVATLAGP